jgi:large subunit ribosomal protein L22
MAITAKLRHLRIAPRKVRLVADLIRGKKVSEALNLLEFSPKKVSPPLIKLLNQAVANAKHNFQLDESNLYISKILVDEGPKLKRWMQRARGQASEIHKRTSHITLVLAEIEKKKPKETKEKEEVGKIKKVFKAEKPSKESKISTGRAKFKPELEKPKPKTEKSIKRIFRRKAI